MNWFKIVLIPLCLTLNIFASSQLDKIRMLTDHWPPYNIVSKGELTGISVELFELMLKKNHSKKTKKDFKVTTWKAAYDTTKIINNNATLTMTRNKIRENDFKWVGPIDTKTSGLICKKSRHISLTSLKDLTKYKISVAYGYSTHQMLKKAGLKKNLVPTRGLFAVHLAAKKLAENKVDIFSTSNIKYIMNGLKTNNFNPNHYEVIKKYKPDRLYFAFNKKTDDKIINQLQKALDELKRDGTYKKIKNKYYTYGR